jgi:recombination-promoting nuclease RpnB
MKKTPLHNPHDKMFRAAMQYPQVAREFLDSHLPENIKKNLDLSTITVCPNSFIDEELKLLQSDVLFKAKAKASGEETYFYVLAEHQSKPDKLMPFRLIQYMIKIWDFLIKNKKTKKTLPLPVIVPLVFYTGKGEYTAASTLWDLCGNQSHIMQTIWTSAFPVINVNTIPDEILTDRVWSGTLEFIMQHRFRQNFNQSLIAIAENLNTLLSKQNRQLVLELLTYIVNLDEEHRSIQELINMIHNQLPPNVESEIMNLAEILKQEGRQEGRFEEKIATAEKMLLSGSDPAFVVTVTELSLQEVKKMKKQLGFN